MGRSSSSGRSLSRLLMSLCLGLLVPVRPAQKGADYNLLLDDLRDNVAVQYRSARSLDKNTISEKVEKPVKDEHKYYTTSYGSQESNKHLWVDMDAIENTSTRVHGILSNTHRQAARVNITFPFLFYGHYLHEVTIATGGFIYTGEVIHRMLTATQYIAPLMANFDPSLSKNSTVRYVDNGSALVVQWDRVHLKDQSDAGAFTFQASLHNDGKIIFAYKDIPFPVSNISTENHAVKVGLSDAFVVEEKWKTRPSMRRKTIFEYNRLELDMDKVTNYSVVQITPLPTCQQLKNCTECVTSDIDFECSWCDAIQRCSSGFDRHRQEWVDHRCSAQIDRQGCMLLENNISSQTPAMTVPVTKGLEVTLKIASTPITGSHSNLEVGGTNTVTAVGVVFGLLITILIITSFALIIFYIYQHPTSAVGLFFIEHRPKTWPAIHFRRGSGHPSYTEVEGNLEKEIIVEAEH
uniref:plexin domain-containing protein 2-like isoform X2 n=1 Tax=Myxine glutinosa TaxID=7769 RepID=UPI00358FA438